MARLSPTTKVQVSGHKFLKRRMAHGLVFGDIRMIHDPLARRRRAALFGGAASLLMCVGAGAMAMFSPDPAAGDAPILEAEGGQLYARVDELYHPVPNLTSARLLAGETADAVAISDTHLAELPKGYPLGIVDAPGVYARKEHPEVRWLACHTAFAPESRAEPPREETLVAASTEALPPLFDGAVYAQGGGKDYVLTAQGRFELPPAALPEGRALRRAMGIGQDTRAWRPPADVLMLFEEHAFAMPPADATILRAGEKAWLTVDGGLTELSTRQAEMLAAAGVRVEETTLTQINQSPDGVRELSFPDIGAGVADPSEVQLCADADGRLRRGEGQSGQTLAGASVATQYRGTGASLAVDTGSGTHVVSEAGRRHRLEAGTDPASVGIGRTHEMPWLMLRLLPEGTPLGVEQARMPLGESPVNRV